MKNVIENNKSNSSQKLQQAVKKVLAVRELFMLALVILAGIVLTILSPHFLTYANIQSVFIGLVPNAILAIGMTILLASGSFDLSVGGVLALEGTLIGLFLMNGMPIFPALILVIFIGLVVGSINGLVIAKLNVNPLIATFGMLSIARSVSLILTEGYSIFGLPQAFSIMGSVSIFGTPLMVWTMIILVIIGDIFLRNTTYLRQVFYIGGNEQAALLSGIKVTKVKVITYIISSLMASIAGIILASRLMAGTPTAGSGIELAVIAACVIGGASLNGGEGTILGSFLGVLFLSIISNALVIMSASVYWHGVVNGLILLIAVSLDMWIRGRKSNIKKQAKEE